MSRSEVEQVTFEDVQRAASALQGVAHRTPVHTSTYLNELTGGSLFLKCENFQRTGAFKFRGGFYAVSRLSDAERHSGVLTYSSGNHAQALALAGKLQGVAVSVIMPDDAPVIKKRATAGYGAEIILYNKYDISREELAAQISTERHLPVIPPYDHVHVIAGQGTSCMELHEEIEELDMVLTPCGGGGLLSGSSISTRALNPSCKIVGVEPEQADDALRSFESGEIQTVSNPETIADGARTPFLGKITFPIILQNVDKMVSVSEQSIIQAMALVWERMKIVIEPTAALGIAAILERKVDARGKRIGIVISGGNVDIRTTSGLFASVPDYNTLR
jgi:threo-3-hydroxy-L-aspartate ammonia-lyase